MAGKSNIDRRRTLRTLEAKRDQLLMQQEKAKTELAKVRAELKSVKSRAK
jgi:vacuolar-type H+-ATPase subunit D/Vma8